MQDGERQSESKKLNIRVSVCESDGGHVPSLPQRMSLFNQNCPFMLAKKRNRGVPDCLQILLKLIINSKEYSSVDSHDDCTLYFHRSFLDVLGYACKMQLYFTADSLQSLADICDICRIGVNDLRFGHRHKRRVHTVYWARVRLFTACCVLKITTAHWEMVSPLSFVLTSVTCARSTEGQRYGDGQAQHTQFEVR